VRIHRLTIALVIVVIGVLITMIFAYETSRRGVEPHPKIMPIFVEYESHPESLADLVKPTDAIVVGTVKDATYFFVATPTRSSIVRTRHRVIVGDVVKDRVGNVRVGSTIEVVRHGGRTTRYGEPVIVEEAGFPPFVSGSMYVLFLNWAEGIHAYHLDTGPSGAYRIVNDRIHSSMTTTLGRRFEGLGRDRFLAMIRTTFAERPH
jgi:hypothetical protein